MGKSYKSAYNLKLDGINIEEYVQDSEQGYFAKQELVKYAKKVSKKKRDTKRNNDDWS